MAFFRIVFRSRVIEGVELNLGQERNSFRYLNVRIEAYSVCATSILVFNFKLNGATIHNSQDLEPT